MQSLLFCYAPEDESFALEMSEFLEANLHAKAVCGECVTRPGFDLIDAVERAISAEVAIVLLSPFSVPREWVRARWESAFFDQPAELGTSVVCVMLAECAFPAMLRRQRFFDGSAEWKEAARELKQWLINPAALPSAPVEAELRDLRAKVSDRPNAVEGVPVDVASRFIVACAPDFEAVHRIDGHERTAAGIAGDLRRAGIAAEGRVLLVLDRFPMEHRVPTVEQFPRASVIFTSGIPETSASGIGSATARMRTLLETDPEAALKLGWELVRVLDVESPIEARETLDLMARVADPAAKGRIERARAWVTGDAPRPVPVGTQMKLCLNL